MQFSPISILMRYRKFKWIQLKSFSCDQTAIWMVQFIRPSFGLSITPFRSYYQWQRWCPCKRSKSEVKGQGHSSKHNLAFSGPWLQFEFTYDDEMMHKTWCCIGEGLYCFSRSSVKFQGHTGKKNRRLDPNWAFANCNSSFHSLMALKWCTKLDVIQKRCPNVIQGHPTFDLDLYFPGP